MAPEGCHPNKDGDDNLSLQAHKLTQGEEHLWEARPAAINHRNRKSTVMVSMDVKVVVFVLQRVLDRRERR